MSVFEYPSLGVHATPAKSAASEATAANARSSGTGLFCPILGGKPRGRGQAEISISTIKHPTVAVGMTGILVAIPGKFVVTAVKPGVATARLEGPGVEKLRYASIGAVVDPSPGLEQTNDSITPADRLAAKQRISSGSGGGPR